MTPTREKTPAQQALHDASAWLEDARKVDGRGTMQACLDTLKSGRALVVSLATELGTLVNPRPAARGRRSTKVAEAAPGLDVLREAIYSTPIDRPGWYTGLILALATAKKMGVPRFEIEMVGDPEADSYAHRNPYYGAGMFGPDDDANEWRRGRNKEPDAPVITLFAVRVG